MGVMDYLDQSNIKYDVMEHPPAFTAQHVAALEHEPGQYVAKPVIINADGKYIMCVLPACYKIDMGALKKQLGASSVTLADENEIGRIFGDCELGAEPPLGNLYDLPTVMDKTLEKDDHIVFQAGTHEKAVRMNMEDYRRLVEPVVMEFSYHMSS